MSDRWSEMDDVDLLQLEAEMRQELTNLREAATVYAERAWDRGGVMSSAGLLTRPAPRSGWLPWAAAGLAAAVLAVGGVRLAQHAPQEEAARSAREVRVEPASAVSDEALLEQIQSDLSTGVPAAMEPLQASEAHGVAASRGPVRQ